MGTNKQYKNNAKKQKGEVFFIEGFSFFVVDCMKVGFLTPTLPAQRLLKQMICC